MKTMDAAAFFGLDRRRRAIVFLLALLLLLSLSACSGRTRLIDGVMYEEYPDFAGVKGCDAENASPVIATEYAGKPVTVIGTRAFTGTAADEIAIPASVTTISEYAFAGSGIRRAEIPETVTEISSGAFMDCVLLESVTVAGAPSLSGGVFKGCTALKSAVFTGELPFLDLNAFEGCTGLEEIHVPRGCEVKGVSGLPEGAALFVKDQNAVDNAIRNGWRYVIEEDENLIAGDLPSAVGSGLVRWSLKGDGDVRPLIFENAGDRELALTVRAGDAVEGEGKTYFVLIDGYSQESERVFFLEPGESTPELPAMYCSSYGPGSTSVEFVADGEFTCFRVLGRALETVETVTLSPYERRALTLPCGRYGFAFAYGGSEEDALDELGTEYGYEFHYLEFYANERYEVSLRKLEKREMQVERFGEYGPETSALLLRAGDQAHSYKLIRVGGGEEFSILLSAASRAGGTYCA